MAIYTLTDGTRKTQLTISGDTTVVFPTKLDYFGVRSLDGANILVSKIKAPTILEDGVYSTDEGDGDVVVDDGVFTDTLYLKGTGTVVVYGGAKSNHLPFKAGGKGGDDGGTLRMLGATTTPLSDGATTNPITIDGQSVTAEKNDVAIYNTREFYFSGTTWSEFGGQMDTVPTQGSANAVTSDGIKTALDTKQNVMQYTTMPTITTSMLGKVVQYVGTSDSNYKQGWNYVAVSDGEETPTYSWQELTVGKIDHIDFLMPGINITINSEVFNDYGRNLATGLGAHAEGIESQATGQGSHAESYSRAFATASHAHANGYVTAGANFATAMGYMTIAQAPNSTVVGTCNKIYDTSQGETIPDLLFVVGNGRMLNPPQPPVFFEQTNILEVDYTSMNVNGDIKRDGVGIDDYTTTERKIGKWIDGSDLYQRTFEATGLSKNTWNNSILDTSDIKIVDFTGLIYWLDNQEASDTTPLNYYASGSDNCFTCINTVQTDMRIYPTNTSSAMSIDKAVITIKYTKPSVQALNANLIPSDNPFNVSVMESSETPTSNEEPTDEMR